MAWLALTGAVGLYALCLRVADVDPARLWAGLPRLWTWVGRAFPPDFTDLSALLQRAAETVAMATVGTSFAAVIAVPLCLLAARNVAPSRIAYYPARLLLDGLRGIDSFIFALILVAAVGLGPFAGVLGIALHSAGSIAKLWSEAIEQAEPGPLEAAMMSGAGRLKIVAHALLPDVLALLASILLYVWEFNVRASTVLGIVGAGGIGFYITEAIRGFDFRAASAIILMILGTVFVVDFTSSKIRERLT